MGRLIKSRTDRLFRKYSESVIASFASKVRFYAVMPPKITQCPNCIFDSSSGSGTGKYNGTGPSPFEGNLCPVCSNNGKVTSQEIKKRVDVNLRYLRGDKAPDEPLPEGSLPQKFARVKSYFRNQSIFEQAQYFLVDGLRYQRYSPPSPSGLLTNVTTGFVIQRDD